MGTALFELDDVSVGEPGVRRLDSVCGAIPDSGVTVVVGPSGSGKSSLLRLCNRLDAPTSGTVRFRGADVADLDPLQHRRRVGMVFQTPVVFPGTVLDNLAVARPGITPADGAALLERVALGPDLLGRDAGTLSGGEAQRVVLARALATGPEVLLADEPTSALDGHATARLEELASSLAAGGLPIVWVTHDLGQMRRLAGTVVVVIGGRWVWDGPPGQLGSLGGAAGAFLGEGS